MDSVVAIIPARFDSTRLPGKPLAEIGGKSMLERVWERARAVPGITRVLVATDHAGVAEAVRAFGGEVALTRPDHPSGTDRIAEVAAHLEADIIVNVQGDLPFLDPAVPGAALACLREDPQRPMATVKAPIHDPAEMTNPNVVKVVTDRRGDALYFSRSPLPFWRDGFPAGVLGYRHLGLYVFRRDFLLRFPTLPPTPLEGAERLEQLRVLEHGYRIGVAEVQDAVGIEVDTPADLQRARVFVENGKNDEEE